MHRKALFLVLTMLAACGPSTAPAPPITPAMVERAKASGGSAEALARGRQTFTTQCNKCHALPDPNGEGADAWPTILAEMSKRAGLSDAEREDVLRYVISARK